tara:strand:- start:342 stop:575 length:234 start_codon:yes stop_codon:yes gene_type:complete
MEADDNKEILDIITERMNMGLERYGHGIRIGDNTKQWGTKDDSWEEMALEEALDGMIYLAASILRIKKKIMESKSRE